MAAHIPKEKRLKLDAKSKEGIFVSYSDNVKGYRIYFPYNKKVEILKDVIFLPKKSEIQENSIFIEPEDDQEEAYEESQVEIQIPQEDAERNEKEAAGGDEPSIEISLDDVYKSCEEVKNRRQHII